MKRLCLTILLLAVTTPVSAVPPIKSSGPIDRAGNQTNYWMCSLSHFQDPSFVADGPTATIVFTGYYKFGTELRDIWIDNVAVTTNAVLLANKVNIQDCANFLYTCPSPMPMFLWENVAPQDLFYFEMFGAGVPAEWDILDLSSSATSTSGPVSILTPSTSGGSLRIGDFSQNGPYASAALRLEGLTPGETYAVSFWWRADNGQDLLTVDIYGHENWKDATTPVLAPAGTPRGIAWGDLSGDGFPEIYASLANSSNLLFSNLGGAFGNISAAPVNDPNNGRGVAMADADNHGEFDLYLGNYGNPNRLYRGGAGMAFTDVSVAPINDSNNATAVSWIDWDNDGMLELYFGNDGQANRLFRNVGGLSYALSTFAPLDDAGSTQVVSWADIDNDGDMDLYLGSLSADKLLRNDQRSGFTDISAMAPLPSGVTTSVDWGDYDNDGDLDAYIVQSNKPNVLLRNDGGPLGGAGTLVVATTPPINDPENCYAAHWVDFDNDGFLDIYVVNLTNECKLFKGDGSGTFTDATTYATSLAAYAATSAAWADKDCDGDVDVYVGIANKPNRMIENLADQNGNHWFQVDLQGTTSNRSGVGARIHVTTGAVTQMREITAGGANLSMNSLTAEFGVGSATLIDEVKVQWPSGQTQVIQNYDVDQKVLIVEGLTAVEGPPPTLERAVLHPNAPNPFNPRTTLAFSLPRAASVDLHIFDARGRRVRTLAAGHSFAAGRHELTWDGTDDAGTSVASGSYVYRMRSGDFEATRSLVLVR